MMKFTIAVLPVLLGVLSLDAHAQPYDSSLLALGAGHPYAPEVLYEVDLVGNATVLAFGLAGFTPGIPLGDRTVPLVPDPVFFASLSSGLFPYLQGNAGTLDQDGHAVAMLDLSTISSVPAGARVWMAAATFDATAPEGLRTISKPVILVFP